MLEELVSAHRHYRASLHAYVIMPEHLHCVSQLPKDMGVSQFVQRLKTRASKLLSQNLSAEALHGLQPQQGLNQRSIWQRSFRSIVLDQQSIIQQKSDYIHMNPVRRNLCEKAIDYPWSSAWFHEFGDWDDEFGLPLDVEALTARNR